MMDAVLSSPSFRMGAGCRTDWLMLVFCCGGQVPGELREDADGEGGAARRQVGSTTHPPTHSGQMMPPCRAMLPPHHVADCYGVDRVVVCTIRHEQSDDSTATSPDNIKVGFLPDSGDEGGQQLMDIAP